MCVCGEGGHQEAGMSWGLLEGLLEELRQVARRSKLLAARRNALLGRK